MTYCSSICKIYISGDFFLDLDLLQKAIRISWSILGVKTKESVDEIRT